MIVNLMGFRATQETNLCICLGECFQELSLVKPALKGGSSICMPHTFPSVLSSECAWVGSRALHIFLETSQLLMYDPMMLTFTEVKLCFFLAFKIGKVVKLRFLALFVSIEVLQEKEKEREREQRIKLALGMEVYAYNTSIESEER